METLTFQPQRGSTSTNLTKNGRLLYTLETLTDGSSSVSNGSHTTRLMNAEGKIFATHIVLSKRNELVSIGKTPPVKRNQWLPKGSMFSRGSAKFKHGDRMFKWNHEEHRGINSLELRDQTKNSKDCISRYTSSRTVNKDGGYIDNATLEVDPRYRHVWDYFVFSLVVLEKMRGGAPLNALSVKDEGELEVKEDNALHHMA